MSYLNFVDAGVSDSGKTKLWDIVNTRDEHLGMISWHAPWRKYTAHLSGVYDPDCLDEISTFVRNATLQHRSV